MDLRDKAFEVLIIVDDRAEAEITVGTGRTALTRFANSFIHQNVAEDKQWARLKLVVDGRAATGSTNRLDRDSLIRLVDETLEVTRLRPVDPDWPGLAPPTAWLTLEDDRYDPKTERSEPETRAQVVKDFVDASGTGDDQLRAAGYCATKGWDVYFANNLQHRAGGRASSAAVDAIHRTPTSDSRGWQFAPSIADIDGAAAGRLAAERARAAANPVDLEPGRYEVVLEPACVADMMDFLADGFNAKTYSEGRSWVKPKAALLDESIDIWDDVNDPRSIGVSFDAEGTPKAQRVLVREGVCRALVHDRRTAKRTGTRSSGHAVPGGEVSGPMPTNLFLAGGDQSPEELVADVERGLLVTDFWYTRILDPKTQVVTGLTRNGTFLIEKGKITGAVRNLRFTQSYVEALGPGNVLGLGDDARLYEMWGGWAHVPSLRLAGWNFTGGAKG
jgi:predicted Zn-dependent protease